MKTTKETTLGNFHARCTIPAHEPDISANMTLEAFCNSLQNSGMNNRKNMASNSNMYHYASYKIVTNRLRLTMPNRC